MKKTGRKMTVFILNAAVLIGVLILIIFKASEALTVIFTPWLFAFIANGTVYITGNVAYAFQRSRNYIKELDKSRS